MTPADLPPSEFVLAHYDDLHRPCGGIAEYIGGWVCRTRIAEGRTRRRDRRPLPPSAIRDSRSAGLGSLALGGLPGLAGPRAGALPAAQLYGAVQGRLERMGAVLWPADRACLAVAVAASVDRLDAAAFAAAEAAGRALPTAAVPTLALALLETGA